MFKKMLSQLKLIWLEVKYSCPPSLYVECTNRCNARCVFCLYPEIEGGLETKILSVDDFESIVRQYKRMGGENISLTPTLADPLTDPFFGARLQVSRRVGISSVSFYTNLISFGKKFKDALRSLDGLDVIIRVSFTGFNKEDYKAFMGVDRYARVKAHLSDLAEIYKASEHLDVKVVMRDYEGSESSKADLMSFLETLGLQYQIETEFDTWGGEVEAQLIASDKLKLKQRVDRDGPCKISFLKPVVTVEGNLKLCDCRDAFGDLEVGNVFDQGLAHLWRSDRVKSLRRLFFTPEKLPKICKKCEHYKAI